MNKIDTFLEKIKEFKIVKAIIVFFTIILLSKIKEIIFYKREENKRKIIESSEKVVDEIHEAKEMSENISLEPIKNKIEESNKTIESKDSEYIEKQKDLANKAGFIKK